MKHNTILSAANSTVANPSHELAMANLDLIDMVIYGSKVVKMCTFLTRDDFYQIGYEALYKAASRYSDTRGAAFGHLLMYASKMHSSPLFTRWNVPFASLVIAKKTCL